MVPNFFGTRPQFRGRHFFPWLGLVGGGFRMIQVRYIYCALYFYYYYCISSTSDHQVPEVGDPCLRGKNQNRYLILGKSDYINLDLLLHWLFYILGILRETSSYLWFLINKKLKIIIYFSVDTEIWMQDLWRKFLML